MQVSKSSLDDSGGTVWNKEAQHTERLGRTWSAVQSATKEGPAPQVLIGFSVDGFSSVPADNAHESNGDGFVM